MAHDPLTDFKVTRFTYDGKSRDVLWMGDGPAVVVMTEMPGITPKVADFARRLVTEGFSVALPDLFGTRGKEPSPLQYLKVLPRACVSREFAAFAKNKTAPVADWLRALARAAHQDRGGPGVGVVGMCFTGGFALALAVDPAVLVPVVSQPSLPFGGKKAASRPGVSAADLAVVKQRVAAEEMCVIGLRFSHDRLSPADRFETLGQQLGEGFLGVVLDSGEGNPGGFDGSAHSVLSEEFVPMDGHPAKDAYDLVVDHLRAKLLDH